jgi:hypothetical protein
MRNKSGHLEYPFVRVLGFFSPFLSWVLSFYKVWQGFHHFIRFVTLEVGWFGYYNCMQQQVGECVISRGFENCQ